MKPFTALVALLSSTLCFATAPSKMVLQNQFGETSINVLQGSVLPLAPAGNVIFMAGATAPINGTTGANIAGPGSLYVAKDTGVLYTQTSVIASPVWVSSGSAGAGALLTGYVSGAGVVSATDTIVQGVNKLNGNTAVVQNGTFTPQTETVSAAGAISTTKMETTVSNGTGGSYAATLAAPSSQDGQIKIIKMGTATHTVTLACTNIAFSGAYTPTGTTTLTFTNVGDSAIFIAVGGKWVYIGGSAIAS